MSFGAMEDYVQTRVLRASHTLSIPKKEKKKRKEYRESAGNRKERKE
jgi:hypothetical protein